MRRGGDSVRLRSCGVPDTPSWSQSRPQEPDSLICPAHAGGICEDRPRRIGSVSSGGTPLPGLAGLFVQGFVLRFVQRFLPAEVESIMAPTTKPTPAPAPMCHGCFVKANTTAPRAAPRTRHIPATEVFLFIEDSPFISPKRVTETSVFRSFHRDESVPEESEPRMAAPGFVALSCGGREVGKEGGSPITIPHKESDCKDRRTGGTTGWRTSDPGCARLLLR